MLQEIDRASQIAVEGTQNERREAAHVTHVHIAFVMFN
jgi:hypothetical protein